MVTLKNTSKLGALFVSTCLLLASSALAQHSGAVRAADADFVEAEKLRREISSQVQLIAANLLDELVYAWTQAPPFDVDTPVVLAGLSVPVGLGSGLTAFLENHFFELATRNPRSHIKPVYCPACTNIFVRANQNGTLLSRGVDDAEVLSKTGLSAGAKYALHLDFEAEGSTMVLRAYITALQPELPIVWAKSISSATTAGALLRSSTNVVSAADARQEYLDLLQGRDRIEFPIRFIYRSYKEQVSYYYTSDNFTSSPVTAPFLWLEAGAEMSFTQNRVWGGGFNIGYTTLHNTHEGFSFGTRINRLISGPARSLLRPDLYLVGGLTLIQVKGPNAANFIKHPKPTSDILDQSKGNDPKATFAAWKLGVDMRIKHRFSAGFYLETMPSLQSNFGEYLDLGIRFQAMNMEVGLWF